MLVIGRNNVFHSPNSLIQFVGHNELNEVDWRKHKKVVIAAFDPQKKVSYSETIPKYINSKVIAKLSTRQVYYISSARVGNPIVENAANEYSAYVRNKIYEETFFSNILEKITVCRVPNLLNEDNRFLSRFQKMVRCGVGQGAVKFDTTPHSTWNFLRTKSILNWIASDEQGSKGEVLYIMSKTNTSAMEVAEYVFKKYGINTTFGVEDSNYKVNQCQTIYLFERKERILDMIVG